MSSPNTCSAINSTIHSTLNLSPLNITTQCHLPIHAVRFIAPSTQHLTCLPSIYLYSVSSPNTCSAINSTIHSTLNLSPLNITTQCHRQIHAVQSIAPSTQHLTCLPSIYLYSVSSPNTCSAINSTIHSTLNLSPLNITTQCHLPIHAVQSIAPSTQHLSCLPSIYLYSVSSPNTCSAINSTIHSTLNLSPLNITTQCHLPIHAVQSIAPSTQHLTCLPSIYLYSVSSPNTCSAINSTIHSTLNLYPLNIPLLSVISQYMQCNP